MSASRFWQAMVRQSTAVWRMADGCLAFSLLLLNSSEPMPVTPPLTPVTGMMARPSK